MYEYAARLTRVIDGDTADLLIDVGFHIHVAQRVRLRGVNCPEHGTLAGSNATAYTNQWLAQHGPDLTVHTVLDRTEKYGRVLGRITANGRCLNDDLVTDGHAVAYDGGKRTLPRQGQPDPPEPVL